MLSENNKTQIKKGRQKNKNKEQGQQTENSNKYDSS